MNIKKNVYFLLGFLLLFCSCKDSLSTTYSGCCGTPSLSTTIGNVSVFIPNTFTPNYDLHNDNFLILTNGAIGKITDFTLKDKSNNIVWESGAKTINPNENFITTKLELDKIPEGKLNYAFKVTPITGAAVQLQGFICKNTSKDVDCPTKNLQCTFSEQNRNGVYDKNIPTGEICQ
jgi:hypothetical protein